MNIQFRDVKEVIIGLVTVAAMFAMSWVAVAILDALMNG